jgi:hypothetical protein
VLVSGIETPPSEVVTEPVLIDDFFDLLLIIGLSLAFFIIGRKIKTNKFSS